MHNENGKQEVEKDQKSADTTVANVRSDLNLGCVSQDAEFPEPTVGLANVRQSIL